MSLKAKSTQEGKKQRSFGIKELGLLRVAIGEGARDYILILFLSWLYRKNKDDKNTRRLMQSH